MPRTHKCKNNTIRILIAESNLQILMIFKEWLCIELCKRYIEVQPDAPEGYYRLGIAYAEDKRYGLVLEIAHAMGERFPMDVRWIALEGQAHAARGDPDRALGLFRHYLQRLPESERVYYEDLSLVALPEELEALKDVPLTDREAFVANFWQQKSGALLLGGPGRRVEHYRRVWYARTFFWRIEPWDRRGEVYIRYGEPDYRSRSGHPNSLPGLAVQYVKEQKAIALYERSMSYRGQEPDRVSLPLVFPGEVFIPPHESFIPPQPGWLWEVKGPSGRDVHLNKPPGLEAGIEPVFPVPRSMYGDILVPWESWVYVDVAGGTEFVFIDPYRNGHWDFPAPPHKNLWHTQLVTMLSQSAPAVVLMKTAARTPEYFDVPPGVEVLDFYYATASFKGKKAKTNMEVYFGVPTEQLAEGQTEMLWLIVLADAQGNTTYRLSEEVQEARSLGEMPDGVLVSLASVAVLPGTYQLGVKLVDQNGGKWGMYQQEVTIPEFSDSLGLSDLEVAWNISKNEEAGEFRKGDLWVIPMPSRSYWQNQSVYIYYEVYDLQQDVFNQTHYRVTYSIRQVRQRGRNVFGVLVSGVSKLFSSSKPEIIVSYERKGTEPWERIYFELDTKKIAPGLHQLEVQVEDLHSGQIASQQTVFRLVRKMSE